MLKAITASVGHLLRGLESWGGIVSTLFGLASMMSGQQLLFPSWGWWLLAITFLFVALVRLQMRVDRFDSPSLRKLSRQTHVTFREIADAVVESETAYTDQEIIHRLLKAMGRGEFETWGGFSRLLITSPEYPPRRMVFRRSSSLAVPRHDEIQFQKKDGIDRAIFEAYLKTGIKDFDDDMLHRYVEYLTLNRSDFLAWHRRFAEGRYE